MTALAPGATIAKRAATPASRARPARLTRRRWHPRPEFWWFLVPCCAYLVLGALLAFRFESFNGDAQARVGNAYYVLFSRDPHLAAIGFVWNPLPSMSVIPVLLFSKLWTPLADRAFAGNIMSAVFMAGTIATMRGLMADLRVRRPVGTVLTLLFAVHPMILYYGANGMSEGLFLFLLVVATRHLMRYLESGATRPLLITALVLALAYYARNEAAAAIGFTTIVVLAVRFRLSRGPSRARRRAALVDTTVVVLPGLFAFVTWAAASWVIVRHPFEQFSSQYGTASQLTAMTAVGFKLADRGLAIHLIVLMAPMLAVVAVPASRRLVRGDLRVLAPIAILGGVLAFAFLAYLGGQTAGWFRYFITAAPMTVVLTGVCLSPPPRSHAGVVPSPTRRATGVLPAMVAVAVALLPSLLAEGVAMADPRVGQEEYLHLSHVFRPGARHVTTVLAPTPRDRSLRERELHPSSARIARYLDRLHLPDGAIVTDTFSPCVPLIVLSSRHPTQFVITNDRDFQRVLDSPSTFHARYFLAPADGTLANLDAINRAYPTLAADGDQVVDPVPAHEFRDVGCPIFRLYRVHEQ